MFKKEVSKMVQLVKFKKCFKCFDKTNSLNKVNKSELETLKNGISKKFKWKKNYCYNKFLLFFNIIIKEFQCPN